MINTFEFFIRPTKDGIPLTKVTEYNRGKWSKGVGWIEKTPIHMKMTTRIQKEQILEGCVESGIIFISLNVDEVVEFYAYDNILNTIMLIKTYDSKVLRDSAPGAISGVDLLYASRGMNCVVINTWISGWRGNTTDYHSVWYQGANRHFPVKIPLDFYGNDKIEAGLQHEFTAWAPRQRTMSYSGMCTFAGENMVGSLGGYTATPLNQFGTRRLWRPIDPHSVVVGETWNEEFSYLIPAIGQLGDLSIMVYIEWQSWYGDGHIEGIEGHPSWDGGSEYHGLLYKSWIEVSNIYQVREPAYAHLDMFTLVPGLPVSALIPESINITQIVGHDGRFFVFYGTIESFRDYLMIEVYDTNLNIVMEKQRIEGVMGSLLSRVSVVAIGNDSFLCFRSTIDGPVYFVNPDTLTVSRTVDIPACIAGISGYAANFVAVDGPVTNYMLTTINDYRFLQPAYTDSPEWGVRYYMPVSYLGYSCKLETCAKLHVNWCAANGKVQHEDANGTLVYTRAQAFGFRYQSTGENMAFIDTGVFQTEQSQIDEVLRLWKESPGHNLNLINRDLNTMGYATAIIPSSFHTIHIGSGGFHVDEGDIELDPSQYGKIKIFVYDVAEG